jgi:hypothetical protein
MRAYAPRSGRFADLTLANAKEKPMKFLMTYAQKPDAPPPSPAQLAQLGAFTEKNIKSGVVVMTGGLVRPSSGIQLRADGGKVSVTDGPFAETKECLAGFYMIEARDLNEAIQIASRIPPAQIGSVEVRVTDGPFAETKELIDGFALVEVHSREEAIALATEFMQIAGDGTGEILQVFDPGPPPTR